MPQYEQAFSQLDGKTKQKLVEDLDAFSTSSSNYYKQYKVTDKLNLDQSQMQNLAAKYQAWTQVMCSAGIGCHYETSYNAKRNAYRDKETKETYKLENGSELPLP